MKASAEIRAEPNGSGGVRLPVLRSEPPLLLRRTPDAVHLVGGAAGPLGGDDLHLLIRVCSGAHLRFRSVAASLAQPDAAGRPSDLTVVVHVEAGASLDWAPEPLVSTIGSHHRVHTAIHLERDASLRWRDITVLGRHDEPSGLIEQDLTVTQDGADTLCQEHAWGPGAAGGWSGPAVLAGARVVATELTVRRGRARSGAAAHGATCVLRFDRDAELATSLGADVPGVITALELASEWPAAVDVIAYAV
ncbi:MAG: urease accessory protein [Frankiaceae bacterium]|nr:urease accessory protein [Frankiaceae bacterium]